LPPGSNSQLQTTITGESPIGDSPWFFLEIPGTH
jgi:hypothetical protein